MVDCYGVQFHYSRWFDACQCVLLYENLPDSSTKISATIEEEYDVKRQEIQQRKSSQSNELPNEKQSDCLTAVHLSTKRWGWTLSVIGIVSIIIFVISFPLGVVGEGLVCLIFGGFTIIRGILGS